MERARTNCYWCISWKRQIAGLCTKIFRNFIGSVWYCDGKRERKDTKVRVEVPLIPWLRSFFLLIETLPITGQKFSNCLKNGGDRLRTCTAYSQVRYKLMKEIGRNIALHTLSRLRSSSPNFSKALTIYLSSHFTNTCTVDFSPRGAL